MTFTDTMQTKIKQQIAHLDMQISELNGLKSERNRLVKALATFEKKRFNKRKLGGYLPTVLQIMADHKDPLSLTDILAQMAQQDMHTECTVNYLRGAIHRLALGGRIKCVRRGIWQIVEDEMEEGSEQSGSTSLPDKGIPKPKQGTYATMTLKAGERQ